MSTSSSITFRSDCDSDYAVDARGSFEKISKQNRRPSYRRSGTAPSSVNGIHRRRQSRWTWGHGRGARLENLRAVARCVIAAVVALGAASASAGVISFGTSAPAYNMVVVGNAGNAVNPSAPTHVAAAGGGSVAYEFAIGSTEVSNAQYAYFLNSVAKTDTFNLYSPSMGISRTGSPGSFVYSTTGANANRPVAFVSQYDAFRFANWLENGQPQTGIQDASTTETGAYTLTGTTGTPTRNPGARFFLPSVNEWYKAAYYNPTLNANAGGYTLYAVNSGTTIPGTAPGGSTTANFNNVFSPTRSIDVGSYTDATSFYGLYDMVGNLAERLDTPIGSGYMHASSWYGTTDYRRLASNNNLAFPEALSTGESASTGFRIAAVPEPSTVVLASMGVAAGLMVRSIRKKSGKRSVRG